MNDSTLNIWAILSFSGAIYGFFLGLSLFFHQRGNSRANRILSIFIAFFSFLLLEQAGYWSGLAFKFPHLIYASTPFKMLFGPLILLYSKIVIDKNFKFKKIYALHLIPFFAFFINKLPFYLLSAEMKLEHFVNSMPADNFSITATVLATILVQLLHMSIYATFTFQWLQKHKPIRNNGHFSIEKVEFKWLRYLIFGFIFFIALKIVTFLQFLYFGYQYLFYVDSFTSIVSSVMIYAAGFMTLRQPEVFSGLSPFKKLPRYKKSSLSPQKAEIYLKQLVDVMKSHKLYLNSDLKLQSLADELSISTHYVSQVLNERLGQNFFDFVNQFRIEDAQKKLRDPAYEYYTILSIALEVGFNSKASFNAAFKKHTQMTPSEFREMSKQAG